MIDEMDEDLAWALKGKNALMEREDEVWKPLLAAAKSQIDATESLKEAVAACEEKP